MSLNKRVHGSTPGVQLRGVGEARQCGTRNLMMAPCPQGMGPLPTQDAQSGSKNSVSVGGSG
jgi:hypothetical protein